MQITKPDIPKVHIQVRDARVKPGSKTRSKTVTVYSAEVEATFEELLKWLRGREAKTNKRPSAA